MELTEYLTILRKYWVSVILILLLGIAGGAAASMTTKPVYTASAGVLLSVNSGETAEELNQGSAYATSQVKSYAQLVTVPMVLQPVIDKLGLKMTAQGLAGQVTSTVTVGTSIITIQATGNDPALTADITNAIAQQLTKVLGEMLPDVQGRKLLTAAVVSPATVPTAASSPPATRNLAVGALVGLLLGVGQALVRNRLNARVGGEPEVA